ncbi:hypothetical protein ACFVXE_17105 [Streptomyces sp. NPDC058231]|uniref:hypothetical protein n=1 Tax=Streptomyces sp. NPDC058231 TaxID=3346392 RepID=UPI0036ED156D
MENWREGARTWHTHEPNDVTVQLDGLGRQLSELPVQPGAPEGSDGPVFVDESGRRSKTFRRLGWVLAAVCACYAVTLVVALLGGNSSAPWLPLSVQEQHKKAEEVKAPPSPSGGAEAVVPAGATPGVTEPGRAAEGGPTPSGSAASGPESKPAKGSSASATATPRSGGTKGGTKGGSTGGGTKPDPVTSVSEPPAATSAPPVDPGPGPSATQPAETPAPPVQEQEGTR